LSILNHIMNDAYSNESEDEDEENRDLVNSLITVAKLHEIKQRHMTKREKANSQVIDIEFFDEFEDNVDREYIRNALGSTQ